MYEYHIKYKKDYGYLLLEDNGDEILDFESIEQLKAIQKAINKYFVSEYYPENGCSPLEAMKKGLISHEEYIGFLKGNVIKYLVRAGKKEDGIQDIYKAIDYLQHLEKEYTYNIDKEMFDELLKDAVKKRGIYE